MHVLALFDKLVKQSHTELPIWKLPLTTTRALYDHLPTTAVPCGGKPAENENNTSVKFCFEETGKVH